jgi:uncharacterized coiled-coil DUF342 family protein
MGNGQHIPSWFKAFLREYREDRDQVRQALRTLTESVQHLAEHVHRNSSEIHAMNLRIEQTNHRIDQTNRELVRTRTQSSKLFHRLITEVKALRPRRSGS